MKKSLIGAKLLNQSTIQSFFTQSSNKASYNSNKREMSSMVQSPSFPKEENKNTNININLNHRYTNEESIIDTIHKQSQVDNDIDIDDEKLEQSLNFTFKTNKHNSEKDDKFFTPIFKQIQNENKDDKSTTSSKEFDLNNFHFNIDLPEIIKIQKSSAKQNKNREEVAEHEIVPFENGLPDFLKEENVSLNNLKFLIRLIVD